MTGSPARWAALCLLLLPGQAPADIFRSGEIRLLADSAPGQYELTARLPVGLAAIEGIEWPEGCREVTAGRQAIAERMQLRFRIACERTLGHADVVRTPWRLDAARFESVVDGVAYRATLTPADGRIIVPVGAVHAADRSWSELAPGMLWAGMLHIWLGWDHLAFVLCLCMLCHGLRLLWLITAFTLGHSLSLALSFLGVLRVPVEPTEALIALSIVLVAREALLGRDPTDPDRPFARAVVLTTTFGLVHGLGFASALTALGISPGERWAALLFFNLGVEIGQIAFVAGLLGFFALLRPASLGQAVRTSALYVAVIVGSFWLLERVAGFA